MARARLQADSRYTCLAPEVVKHPAGLIAALREQGGDRGTVLVGFDFPIGLPLAYARKAGIDDFLTILPQLGKGQWARFYDPALSPDQINVTRPFYPAQSGNARQAHLLKHLGLESMDDLRRRCERAHTMRRAACPLFWTLGAQQVGKAAISGWQEILAGQNRILPYLSIWPFSGSLEDSLTHDQVIVAETYPAEYYVHLGAGFSTHRRGEKSGKRDQRDRAGNAAALLGWAKKAGVVVSPELETALKDGFGPSPDGEDPFDAVVGLFGMLNVILGYRPPGEPEEEAIRKIEGWILGQSYL
jgi:hypothetical protein